jgi:hypothetical protein
LKTVSKKPKLLLTVFQYIFLVNVLNYG